MNARLNHNCNRCLLRWSWPQGTRSLNDPFVDIQNTPIPPTSVACINLLNPITLFTYCALFLFHLTTFLAFISFFIRSVSVTLKEYKKGISLEIDRSYICPQRNLPELCLRLGRRSLEARLLFAGLLSSPSCCFLGANGVTVN